MKLQSELYVGASVPFPSFEPERVYMRKFFKQEGLPEDLSKWQPTVDRMLMDYDGNDPIFIMIDCATVLAGQTHRRKGMHIDGYWNEGGHGGHTISAHGDRQSGRWGSRHSSIPPSHGGRRHSAGASSWKDATFEHPEAIILASNIAACVGYRGEFEGPIGDGGDCSHVDLSSLERVDMEPFTTYLGNVTCLHASMPVTENCDRQLVRLNVHNWTP